MLRHEGSAEAYASVIRCNHAVPNPPTATNTIVNLCSAGTDKTHERSLTV